MTVAELIKELRSMEEEQNFEVLMETRISSNRFPVNSVDYEVSPAGNNYVILSDFHE